MHALLITLLIALPIGALVGVYSTQSRSRYRNVARQHTYTLQDFYQTDAFLTEWSFFSGPDLTGGNVYYVQDAVSEGLMYFDYSKNTTVLAVDSWSTVPAGGYRNSVRITSNKNYTGGLFILDALAMPVGCGTWPSFWTNGPNWPAAGEIDIVEGVNKHVNNQMTLHSGTPGACTLDKTLSTPFTGNVLGTDCTSTSTADSGCGISDPNPTSFGYEFNNVSGGVYAFLWDTAAGMTTWHFARADIPADITSQTPTPANWGTPVAAWSSQTCNIADAFYQHSMIIDTTLCGNWATADYPKSGCPGTCSDMIANATNFANAQWIINYVAVYQ